MINQRWISIFRKLSWKWKDCRLRKGSWLTLKLLESYESLRSVSSYESELIVSDFTVSLTPSPDHCGRNSLCSSMSSKLCQSENQIDSDGGDRVGRCYSDLSGESYTCHQKGIREEDKIIFWSTSFRSMKITLVLKHPRKNFIQREKHIEKHELPAEVWPI